MKNSEDKYLGLEYVLERNSFYFHRYQHLLLASCILLMLNILLGALLYKQYYSLEERPKYIATTFDGIVIKRPGLRHPLPEETVVQWIEKAVAESYSFDYINYRRTFRKIRKYFDSWGYNNYLSAMKQSNNLNAVINRKQVVYAQPIKPIKIIRHGIRNGRYAWKARFKMVVKYQNASEDIITDVYNVEVLVTRVDVLEGDSGLAIRQLLI